MDVVLGIAAKSLDAAYQLAKALHGPQPWAYQQSLGIQSTDISGALAPEAGALLLLSHDSRTAYVLIATHATAADYLRAVAGATTRQCQRQHLVRQRPAAAADGDSKASAAAAAAAAAPADAGIAPQQETVPPLQRLQQLHDVAVNVLLLQLFLVCDAVLVLLPTGQGLELTATGTGSLTGAGGDPLAGASDWMTRLRLLQGAKRALYECLCEGRTTASTAEPPPRGRAPQPPRSGPAVAASPGGAALGGAEGLLGGGAQQLRSWLDRSRAPPLIFVTPSDVGADDGHPWGSTTPTSATSTTSSSSASRPTGHPQPGGAVAGAPRSGSAARGGGGAAAAAPADADDPRDANWLLRHLLKRCRPVPLTASPTDLPPPLCLFNPSALVLDSGPLALQPEDVRSSVLAALLAPEDGGGQGLAAGGQRSDGMARLQETLTAALAAAAAATGEAARREAEPAEGGAAAAASRMGAAWRAAAAQLHAAALAAWREARAQPLEWVPPVMEVGPVQRPVPGYAASTAHGRPRQRGSSPATAAAAAAAAAAAGAARGQASSLESAAAWLAAGGGAAGLAVRLTAELCREAADAAVRQYATALPPRYPERVHAAAVAAAVAALRAAAPPGPAADAAAARLRAACEEEWRRGRGGSRRQCSSLSATGRPCTKPIHGPAEPHCSETTVWTTTSATGSTLMSMPDPFDVQAANTAPLLDDGSRVAGASKVAAAAPAAPGAAPVSQAVGATAADGGGGGGGGAAGRAKGGKKGGSASASPVAAEASTGGVAAQPSQPQSQPLQKQPQPQQQQLLLPAHSRHLMVAVAQAPDGSTRHCVLGPWVSVTRLGPASSYNDRRGLTNQPGLNGSCLYPLILQPEAESAPGTRAGGAGRGPKGSSARHPTPRAESTDSSAAPGGAGSAAAGSDSEYGGVVLDEQSFPSLAEAAAAAAQGGRQQPGGASQRRGGAGGKQQQQQQQQSTSGGKATAAGAGGGADAGGVASASRERERLIKAWPYPQKSVGGGGKAAAGGAGGAVREGTAAPPPRGGRRGRGPGSGAQGGGGGPDHAAFPPLATGGDGIKRVYVSYEYQTLDGRRFLATPQQLASTSTSTSSAEAAAAAAPPARAIPPQQAPPQPQHPNRRGGRAPPGGQAASGAAAADVAVATGGAAAAVAAAAAAAAALGSNSSTGAANFLLQHDVPLYMLPPPGLQPDPSAPMAQDGAAGWDPTPRRPAGLAQLRRIFVVTPASASGEALLAARPTVQFRLMQEPQLPRDAAAAAGLLQRPLASAGTATDDATPCGGGGGAGGGADDGNDSDGTAEARAAQLISGTGAAAAVVQVSLARPAPLPPDSLVVICLPMLYGLPAEWLGWGSGLLGGEEANGDGDAGSGSGSGAAAAAGSSAAGGLAEGATGANMMGSAAERGELQGDAAGEDVQDQGGGGGGGGGGGAQAWTVGSADRQQQPGPLVPLVPLDERTPHEARLLAGSALFPLPLPTA